MRRISYILSFFLIATLTARSQVHAPTSPDPDYKFIKFYPNPAVSQITFDFQNIVGGNEKNYSLVIFNFLGKKVFESPSLNSKNPVNLTDFFRGIYIFQLKDQNGKIVESSKFQVLK